MTMPNKIRWQAALAGVLLAALGCMQAQPTIPAGPGPAPRPSKAPEGPSPQPSNYQIWIAHTFDADVTGKGDGWFEVKTRKGKIYHIVPDKDFAERPAPKSPTPNIAYSQVKVGQRLRLHLYYGLPVSVADMLVGAKPVPPLKCLYAQLWGVDANGTRWPITGEIIDD
jgi:hypothetical protein